MLLQILGVAGLPVAHTLLRRLPDGGYAFAKPLGLLLSGYLLWLLASLGFAENSPSAAAVSILAVGAVGWGFYAVSRGRDPGGVGLAETLRRRWRAVVAVEVLFAVSFLVWAVVRAHNPEIEATEKPMEFAFLNGILRSDRFPPHDPWLSGFAISYYYFGYVMMAMLIQLSGVASGVGFNLGMALLFALTATGAFGVVFNAAAKGGGPLRGAGSSEPLRGAGAGSLREGSAIGYGLLGSLFVAGIGNLEGLLEFLHARGIGSEGFWSWIDIKNLASAPVTGGIPTDNWWWWRASRVVHDQIGDFSIEVIDEFPFFSFLLGDMHPHVLALPFVFVVLGLALSLLRRRRDLRWHEMLLVGVIVGSLGFLNAWDLPTYGLIVVAGYGLGRRAAGNEAWLRKGVWFAAVLIGLSLVLYLPFYLGLRSQARGLLPVLFVKTRLHQYLIMFGPFLAILVAFLALRWRDLGPGRRWLRDWGIGAAAILAAPLVLIAAALAPIVVSAQQREYLMGRIREGAARLPPEVTAGLPLDDLGALARRGLTEPLVTHPWLILALSGLISASMVLFWRWIGGWRGAATDAGDGDAGGPDRSGTIFAGGLFSVALGLTFVTEFIYVHDTFGTRMNTVFKLWYQAWILFGVASALALSQILPRLRTAATPRRLALGGLVGLSGLLFLATLVYPPLSVWDKTRGFAADATLDGTAYLARRNPDDSAAISWLNHGVEGSPVILEATGGSYTYAGRISAFTGLPTLLGWGGHELQWRGNYDEPARREPLIDALYTARDPSTGRILDPVELASLMDGTGVTYLYFGLVEERQYGTRSAVASRWEGLVELVYDTGGSAIFRRIGAGGLRALGG